MERSNQKIIDRTNNFYLEMSKRILTDQEYRVVHMLLIEKKSLVQTAEAYNITAERIRQIFKRTCKKVSSFTQLLDDIQQHKEILTRLKNSDRYVQLGKKEQLEPVLPSPYKKMITESVFPLSTRMFNLFHSLEIQTIGDMAAISLEVFGKIRGFGPRLKKELIAYIEFENIEHLFDGFEQWKE